MRSKIKTLEETAHIQKDINNELIVSDQNKTLEMAKRTSDYLCSLIDKDKLIFTLNQSDKTANQHIQRQQKAISTLSIENAKLKIQSLDCVEKLNSALALIDQNTSLKSKNEHELKRLGDVNLQVHIWKKRATKSMNELKELRIKIIKKGITKVMPF